jgi:predicted enzyme related to lactoylglutathione lyase
MTLAEKVKSNVTTRQLHAFWWMDIATKNYDRATNFYGKLFDWTFDDLDPNFHYANAYRGGNRVAGFSDMVQEGQPTFWTPYVLVEDAAAVCKQASALGATVLWDAMQVGEFGWMAVIQDPQGAVFGLWQAGTHKGAELANVEGALAWNELNTTDIEAAIEFYGALFGWTAKNMEFPGMEYYTWQIDGRSHGGLRSDDAPVHWSVTVGVENADDAIEWVTSQDGKIVFGPTDTPFGRVVGIQDPDGAFLTLMQPPTPGADDWDTPV